jgi:Flp pilus assembly protein TadD
MKNMSYLRNAKRAAFNFRLFSDADLIYGCHAPASIYFERAKCSWEDGNRSLALQIVDKACEIHRHDIDLLSQRVGMLRASGFLEQAAETLERIVALEPDVSAIHNELGMVYLSLKKPKKAHESFKTAVSLDPKAIAPRIRIIRHFMLNGASAEAEQHLAELVGIAPDDKDVLAETGRFFLHLRDFASAQKYLTQALEKDPHAPITRRDLGLAHIAVGKFEAARDVLHPSRFEAVANELLESSKAHPGSTRYRARLAIYKIVGRSATNG